MSDEMPGDWEQVNQFTFQNMSCSDEIFMAARLDSDDKGSVIAVYDGADFDSVMSSADHPARLLSELRDFMAQYPVGASQDQI